MRNCPSEENVLQYVRSKNPSFKEMGPCTILVPIMVTQNILGAGLAKATETTLIVSVNCTNGTAIACPAEAIVRQILIELH